jgi:hypothetical protein
MPYTFVNCIIDIGHKNPGWIGKKKRSRWKRCIDVDNRCMRDLVSTRYIYTNDFPIKEYRSKLSRSVCEPMARHELGSGLGCNLMRFKSENSTSLPAKGRLFAI